MLGNPGLELHTSPVEDHTKTRVIKHLEKLKTAGRRSTISNTWQNSVIALGHKYLPLTTTIKEIMGLRPFLLAYAGVQQ